MTTDIDIELDETAEIEAESYMNTTLLRLTAKMYADAVAFQVSQENKVRSGVVAPEIYEKYLKTTEEIKELAKKSLLEAYRNEVPVAIQEWQASSLGVGSHLIARLLGEIGHPRIAEPYHWEGEGIGERHLVADVPYERTVSQLWQYCGHGKPGRRTMGMDKDEATKFGNPEAKKIVWNIATGIVKASVRRVQDTEDRKALSAYGQLYLDTKAKYALRTHTMPCPGGAMASSPTGRSRCKVEGADGKKKYADIGDPFQPGHIEAIAKRRVGKEILRDLWIAAEM